MTRWLAALVIILSMGGYRALADAQTEELGALIKHATECWPDAA